MKTKQDRWSEIDAAVANARPTFCTLTSEDWAREIRRARAVENAIIERMRAKLGNHDNGGTHGPR